MKLRRRVSPLHVCARAFAYEVEIAVDRDVNLIVTER